MRQNLWWQIVVLFLLIETYPGFTHAAAEEERDEVCQALVVEGNRYTHCRVPLPSGGLGLAWRDPKGESFRDFSRLADDLAGRDRKLVFALNAGMYDANFSPVGLYVEEGKVLTPLNLRKVEGGGGAVPNFYKQPNGVFYLTAKGAGILSTGQFAATKPDVVFATQSGPMLVIDGKINSIFISNSTDKRRRSGVGVCEGNQVSFLVSDDAVNFADFASVFQTALHCPNALFLDGGRGAGLFESTTGRSDTSGHGGYGPMIVYSNRQTDLSKEP